MRQFLSRIDDSIEVIERLTVLVFLSIMSASVFLDVVHRISATPNGIILKALLAVWPGETTPETVKMLGQVGVPLVAAVFAWIFCYGALRTAKGSTLSVGASAGGALVITAFLALFIFGLLRLFPHGLVWSQPLSLGLLLWVALLGATLATKARGHIILEAAEKMWPPQARRWTRLAGGLIATSFCVVLVVLGAAYTADFYTQWTTGVGFVSGVRLPKWCVLASMPICFALMGARFIAYSISDFQAVGQATEEA